MIVSVESNNIRNGLAEARRLLKLDPRLMSSKEKIRSGGEDGLYRITLWCGDIVELTIKQHTKSAACLVY